jgi:hypothetical protein
MIDSSFKLFYRKIAETAETIRLQFQNHWQVFQAL